MKKLVITLAAILFAGSMFAQDDSKPRWAHLQTNHFWDNWEISVEGGAKTVVNMPGKKNGYKLNPKAAFTPTVGLNVTKWVTPIVGFRLGAQGGFNTTNYFQVVQGDNDGIENRNSFWAGHFDVMFNLRNWIHGYNPDRIWNNSTVYTGIAYASSKNRMSDEDANRNQEWAMPLGWLNSWRLCDAWNISLDLRDYVLRNEFLNESANTNGTVKAHSKLTNIFSALIGVTYRFPNKMSEGNVKRGFSSYSPIDKSKYVDAGKYYNLERDYNDLKDQLDKSNKKYNDEVAELNRKNRELRKALDEKGNNGPVTVAGDTQLGIFFNIGSAEISEANKENINFMADLMKANKDKKFTVTGYADKETGSEARNLELSRERAEAVRNALIKAGVSENQIKVDPKGCTVEPFPGKGYLNRVAIIN
ncbi:MAG: OmpA family protein [Bacteroidales bacterium]|nr:OmpA family protein [Bacteroidales bacterium]